MGAIRCAIDRSCRTREVPQGGAAEVQVHRHARGYARLEKELEELESRRVQVSRNIKTAKGYGDLSENFEYHEAKREQGFVEGRIMELKIILPGAHVVHPGDVPDDQVWFGFQVRVKDLDYEDEEEYAVVGSLEADIDQGRIWV